MPRIQIVDDNQNWLNWGTLVRDWINHLLPHPTTVHGLKQQLHDYSVNATIDPTATSVLIREYPSGGNYTLEIDIPNQTMLNAKMALIGSGPGPYPRSLMPSFYDIAYGGAPRAQLSVAEKNDFALRRVGEYTVNECC